MEKSPGSIEENGSSKKSRNRRNPTFSSLHSSMVLDDHGPIQESTRKTTSINEDDAMTPAIQRAEEVYNALNSTLPKFVREMLHSHVNRGFWLGLPSMFCNMYLPKKDVEITLVDENKEEYTTKYLYSKNGLSGGWKGFAVAHKLVEGDALIFHLVEDTKFEVIIIRANGIGPIGDVKPSSHPRKIDSRKHINIVEEKSPENIKEDKPMISSSKMLKNRGSPITPRSSSKVTIIRANGIGNVKPSSQQRKIDSRKHIKIVKEKSPKNIKEDKSMISSSKMLKNGGSPISPRSSSKVVDGPIEESTSINRPSIKKREAMSPAIERAHEIQKSLNLKFPYFVKSMLPSEVTRVFWLGIPRKFCHMYLPKENVEFTLVDENKEEYATKYLFLKNGLSAGWKRFSDAHGLLEGDALIFHLVEDTKFEVIIIRANSLGDVKPSTPRRKTDSRKHIETEKSSVGRKLRTRKLSELQPSVEDTTNCSGEDISEVLEGTKLYQNGIKFEGIIRDQASFSVVVNGLSIDSELSEYAISKYYKLCSSQNAFLHEKLLNGMSRKLVAGIISETVDIADAIEACMLNLSNNEFVSWDACLGAFEQMGMNVAFLRNQLQHLVGTTKESKKMATPMKHSKLKQTKKDGSKSKNKGNSKKRSKLSDRDTLEHKMHGKVKTVVSNVSREDMDELARVDEEIENLRSQIFGTKSPSKRAAESESKNTGKSKKRSRLSDHDIYEPKNFLDSSGKEEDTREIKICGNPMTVESKIPHEEMDELAAVENDINDLRSQIMALKSSSKKS
ncbi:hypothetical protein Sjap_017232 [Stephania japonica]|uniref:TF-B3 domain-containing protein n=1 Tax=Stephania japonica TaxID=461633 RepID=A0AAP0I5S2_9MAGN